MSISLYIALYYNLLLLLVVYIAIQPVRAETVRQPYINNQIFSLALLLIVYVHVTFRPTDYHYFGDTSAYAMAFQKKAFYGTVAIRDRDIGFEYLTYWLSLKNPRTMHLQELAALRKSLSAVCHY